MVIQSLLEAGVPAHLSLRQWGTVSANLDATFTDTVAKVPPGADAPSIPGSALQGSGFMLQNRVWSFPTPFAHHHNIHASHAPMA